METASDPIALFESLYRQVFREDVPESTAFTLATVGADHQPSARVVLLKDFDQHGFVFYTNLESRKGRELKAFPRAALCFYWESIQYQVRIEGPAEQVADDEADAYFATRPRGSQIGAWASQQSARLSSREELERQFKRYEEEFAGKEIPRPPFWSGFRVAPERMEFWRRRENRLHQRTLYRRKDDTWEKTLLYP